MYSSDINLFDPREHIWYDILSLYFSLAHFIIYNKYADGTPQVAGSVGTVESYREELSSNSAIAGIWI